jgi:hypothetical protein
MISIIIAKAWKFQVRLREKQINLDLALGYQKGTFPKSELFSIRLFFIILTIIAAKNERLKIKKWLKSAGTTFRRQSLTHGTT